MDCEVVNFEHHLSKLFFFISFTPVLCPDRHDLDVTTLTGGCECFVLSFMLFVLSGQIFGLSTVQIRCLTL